MTPMQQQYTDIKSQHPGHIVLFRLGDFYETFSDDAKSVSQILGITLTGRGKDENRVPMAGIPYHALETYLPKLIHAGQKVVIVDQLTEPKPGELVERAVSKIYTAGTLTQENTLQQSKNNYLVAVNLSTEGKRIVYGCVFTDISTGKMQAFETDDLQTLRAELVRLDAAEVIVPLSRKAELSALDNFSISYVEDKNFDFQNAYKLATEQFNVETLKGFGIEELPTAISALGAMLNYLQECQRTALAHIKAVSRFNPQEFMFLDESTIRNLELIYTSAGDIQNTVYAILNNCVTNMGKRKLRYWLLHPLINLQKLQQRSDAVNDLYSDIINTSDLIGLLKDVADIERIVARIGVNSANAKDLLALSFSLQQIQKVQEKLSSIPSNDLLNQINRHLQADVITHVIQLIDQTINVDAPVALNDGGLIKSGYNAEIDELRSLRSGGKTTLAEIQARESERTGIPNLKVGYNNVFGYFIEVTASHLAKVPQDYIRKQTLANAERYITQELKVLEDKILSAEDKLIRLEFEVFQSVRDELAKMSLELLYVADAVADLDVLSNFASSAKSRKYVKPDFVAGSDVALNINQGRHFVVETLVEDFQPNDVSFDAETGVIILTGPNMSGKSTYIRQVALMVLLAQIGAFVPADSMKLSIFDRIFTRVGAADNLSKGESTFMVEMTETANILNNATDRSLVILDEVGRGTSTYDGVAIAWAVVEYIYKKNSKTLFATHYHELIKLAELYPHIKNFNVEVKDDGLEVQFRHRIIAGSASKSYGVHVAQMAGVPSEVITRANQILGDFEDNSAKVPASEQKQKTTQPPKPKKIAPEQLGLL